MVAVDEISASEAYRELSSLLSDWESVDGALSGDVPQLRDVWINAKARIEFYDSDAPLGANDSRWDVRVPWMAVSVSGPATYLHAPLATPDEIRGIRRQPVLRRELPNGDQFVILEHHTKLAMFVLLGTPIDVEPLNGPHADTAARLLKLRKQAQRLTAQAERIRIVVGERSVPIPESTTHHIGLVEHWLVGAGGEHPPLRVTSWFKKMLSTDTSDEVVTAGVITEIDDLRRGIESALSDTPRQLPPPEFDEIAGWFEKCLERWP